MIQRRDEARDEDARDSFGDLLQRVRSGDQDAAWELVGRYGPHVRAVVRRKIHPNLRSFVDSEDFAQSVWLSFVRIGPRLQFLEEPAQLVALLSTMATNKVVDEYRKRFRTQKHDVTRTIAAGDLTGGLDSSASGNSPTPSAFAMAREHWDRILAASPPQTQQMLELRLKGATHDEIAAELNVCVRTVGRALARLEGRATS